MKKLTILGIVVMSLTVQGQVKTPRSSKPAVVSEQVGLTEVTINYSRPGVKGREGKIWGAEVPNGFVDFHYGTSKAAPWRAGANENKRISGPDKAGDRRWEGYYLLVTLFYLDDAIGYDGEAGKDA